MQLYPKVARWAITTFLLVLPPLTLPISYSSIPASAQTISDHKVEANQLLQQGIQQYQQGKSQEALQTFQAAIARFQQLGDRVNERKTLGWMGLIYARVGQLQTALERYQQALAITRAIKDPSAEITTLNNIGDIYSRLGQYAKALEFYQQALVILKNIGDHRGEGYTIAGIGFIYDSLGQYAKALDSYQQAFVIFKNIGDHRGEGYTVNLLGRIYDNLGQYAKALEFYQQALAIANDFSDGRGKGNALNSIGTVYYRLGQYAKALEFYQQALAIRKEIGYRDGEGYTLNNIGGVYYRLGQYAKALDSYQQALAIFKKIGIRGGEGNTLNNIGLIHSHLRQYLTALDSYRRALAIVTAIGDRPGEGRTLTNMGNLLEAQKQPELAIVFLKRSVNIYEAIREDLQALPREQQQSYIQTVADTYRELANILLQQGRVLEGQQVLELLKVQEIRDFTRDAQFGEPTTGLNITPGEQKILDQHGTLVAFSQKVYDCKKNEQHPCAELGQLNQQLYLLNQQYTQAVQSFERELRDRKDPEMVDPGKLVAEAKPIVEAEPGTLLVYPLVLEDKTWLLWVARGGVVKSVEIPISRQQLGKAVVNFRNLVQDRRSTAKQVQAASKRLYDILFQSGSVPLATEMQQNQIRHLVFALDRVTRYIPMAALYDGEHYLTEKYTVSTVIAARLTNVDRVPSNPSNNPVLALGVSESVENLTPLENVPQELNAIVQQSATDTGIYPGHTFLNRDFNQQILLTRLLGHTFLHIATHAAFLPNNPADSFILMGTGKLTIPQIRSLPDLASVRMVVLSACETALGGPDQDGIEISGISSYFLNSGVETVIASLWAVNDASTSLLMQQFYQNLATGTMTKAEALRQAQLSLLRGKVTGNHAAIRADVDVQEETSARAIAEQRSNFSHPYYWAPFILIGNRL